MNLIELERSLRQLRLGGIAPQRATARATAETGRVPRSQQDARQLRLHLQSKDESESGLRSGHVRLHRQAGRRIVSRSRRSCDILHLLATLLTSKGIH